MTTRALTRAGLAPMPHIDLPVGPRPQYVNDRGIEVDEEEVHPLTKTTGLVGVDDTTQQDEDAEMAEEVVQDEIEVDRDPLLSLAER
jgi:hypothetical protein